MIKTKRKLGISLVTILITIFMLLGSTYAWFTDSASNTGNRIEAGTLKVDLLMHNGTEYKSIANTSGDIFKEANSATNSNVTLWEPGKTQLVYLAVKNNGSLALKYNIYIDVTDEGLVGSLEYAIIDGAQYGANIPSTWTAIKEAAGEGRFGTLEAKRYLAAPSGRLEVPSTSDDGIDYFVLAVHMDENAGNKYQGNDAIIDVNVVATQVTAEKDAFDSENYDENATYPSLAPYIKQTVEKDVTNKGESITISQEDIVSTIPASVNIASSGEPEVYAQIKTTDDDDKSNFEMAKDSTLTRQVKTKDATENSVTIDISYIYTEENNSYEVEEFTSVVKNIIPLSKGLISVKVTHSHSGSSTIMNEAASETSGVDGEYYYNSETGILTVWSSKYSDYLISYQYEFVASIGTTGYLTVNDALKAAELGDVITLLKASEKDLYAAISSLNNSYTLLNNNNGSYTVSNYCTANVEPYETETDLTINNADELIKFAATVNAGKSYQGKTITLANDIDLSGKVWQPIGNFTDNISFKGTFDGNNKTISNAYIYSYNKKGVGFFGKVYAPSIIKDLTLENATVVALGTNTYTGGIVGHGYGTIDNCTFKGVINAGNQVGGIAASGGFTITNCTFDGTINCKYWGVGGIIGNCQDGGQISNNTTKGKIVAVLDTTDPFAGGGIIGCQIYTNYDIKNNYSAIKISFNGNDVTNYPIIGILNISTDNEEDNLRKFSNLTSTIANNTWDKDIYSAESYDIYYNTGYPAKTNYSIRYNNNSVKAD